MGIALEQALLFRDWIARHTMRGPLLALGVQGLRFTPADYFALIGDNAPKDCTNLMLDRDFYASCGIDEVVSMDISACEGADIIYDLNRPPHELPKHLVARFGVVVNGGTLEHVFHIPHALATITRALRVGGCVLHIVPSHNAVDHGFYQINPTLLFDYYESARFEILEAASLSWGDYLKDPTLARIAPVQSGTFGDGLLGALKAETILIMLAARKTEQSQEAAIPVQYLYAPRPRRNRANPRWFAPYRTEQGRPIASKPPRVIELRSFAHAGGLAWSTALPDWCASIGDSSDNPIRSPLALFEDDRLLGPPHASHATVREEGAGRYSHWGGGLWLSTSDGTDPNTNGHHYSAIIPFLG